MQTPRLCTLSRKLKVDLVEQIKIAAGKLLTLD